MKKHKIGVVGGAGYVGGEMVRLLLKHPAVELYFVQSRSQAGKRLSDTHRDLLGDTDLTFTAEVVDGADVWFLCMGHGEARQWLEQQPYRSEVKVIDLSHDYRAGGAWGDQERVYGLPELNRESIRNAQLVANPGCFATAIQLALLPLATQQWNQPVYVTGITGSTGAGQALSPTTHFSWRHANISAYKTLTHQHIAEIQMSLTQAGAQCTDVHFVPWRGDFPRGIFVSCTTACIESQEEVWEWYERYYATHPFTWVCREMIDLKMVVNTNKCVVFPEKVGNQLVIHAAIDNLLKGAAGQAVQNMNLMLGLEERQF